MLEKNIERYKYSVSICSLDMGIRVLNLIHVVTKKCPMWPFTLSPETEVVSVNFFTDCTNWLVVNVKFCTESRNKPIVSLILLRWTRHMPSGWTAPERQESCFMVRHPRAELADAGGVCGEQVRQACSHTTSNRGLQAANDPGSFSQSECAQKKTPLERPPCLGPQTTA